MDPSIGSDGFATREALENLGITGPIASQIKLAGTASLARELVVRGEADLCIFYRNEMATPDLDIVGLLPKEFAPPVQVVASSRQPQLTQPGRKRFAQQLKRRTISEDESLQELEAACKTRFDPHGSSSKWLLANA